MALFNSTCAHRVQSKERKRLALKEMSAGHVTSNSQCDSATAPGRSDLPTHNQTHVYVKWYKYLISQTANLIYAQVEQILIAFLT